MMSAQAEAHEAHNQHICPHMVSFAWWFGQHPATPGVLAYEAHGGYGGRMCAAAKQRPCPYKSNTSAGNARPVPGAPMQMPLPTRHARSHPMHWLHCVAPATNAAPPTVRSIT